MCGFLLRIIINAVVLFLIITEVPGVFVDTLGGMLLAVAIVGVVNAAIRPIFMYTARPLKGVHLGGTIFVMNILTPLLLIKALPGFKVYSMISPVVSVCLLTACSFTLSKVIHDR